MPIASGEPPTSSTAAAMPSSSASGLERSVGCSTASWASRALDAGHSHLGAAHVDAEHACHARHSSLPAWPRCNAGHSIALAAALAASGVTAAAALPRARPRTPGRPAARRAWRRSSRPSPALEMLDSRSLGLPHRGRLVRGVRLPAAGPPLRHLGPRAAPLAQPLVAALRQRLPDPDGAPGGAPPRGRGPRAAAADARRRPQPPARRASSAGASARSGTRATRTGSTWTSTTPAATGSTGPPRTVRQVDLRLAQRLVDLFVAAGAQDGAGGARTCRCRARAEW